MSNMPAAAGPRGSAIGPDRGWRHLPALAALMSCALLAGCQSRTNVSATGNAPVQFTHVFLTINQVWFNTSASAAPTDSSWVKFPLATPASVDLVNLNNGTLSQLASELKLAAGTYSPGHDNPSRLDRCIDHLGTNCRCRFERRSRLC